MIYSNTLRLKDSLTGNKKEFSIALKKNITIYVCGITPYSYSHIGHGRSYINFDVLVRTLTFFGFVVQHVRNFTDIDDKLLIAAEKEFGDKFEYPKIAEKYILDFKIQMNKLNCVSPNVEPLATKTIPEIVKLIEDLIEKEFAYKSGHDVFFDISKFKDYGKLSKKKTDDLLAGSRVVINDEKRSPLDFVLWKGNDLGEFWNTSLGFGRPGWHIECSAMINKNCDGELDIHGGGADLIFPHHENEIAQSEAFGGRELAGCWLHNGLLNIKSEKMSKSGSNSLSMIEFFKTVDPKDFRYYILQHHYRSPIDFSPEKIVDARKSRIRLSELRKTARNIPKETGLTLEEDGILKEMVETLSEDLNTAGLLGLVFKHFDKIKTSYFFSEAVFYILEICLGLVFELESCNPDSLDNENENKALINELVQARDVARINKDWDLADKIRDRLKNLGYSQVDGKQK